MTMLHAIHTVGKGNRLFPWFIIQCSSESPCVAMPTVAMAEDSRRQRMEIRGPYNRIITGRPVRVVVFVELGEAL